LLLYLGLAALDRDRYERMVALLEEGMVLFRKLGDKYGVGVCCYTMGIAALNMGDPERAAALLEEAMHALQQLGDKVAIFHCLLGAAGVAGSRGELAPAATVGSSGGPGRGFRRYRVACYPRPLRLWRSVGRRACRDGQAGVGGGMGRGKSDDPRAGRGICA
jgi:hypothetical protein